MKCEKCGNDYPSQYYFATPTICQECFKNLQAEEQQEYLNSGAGFFHTNELLYRIGFGRRLGATLLDYLILSVVIIIVFQANGFFQSYMNMISQVKDYASNPTMLQELQTQFLNENMSNFFFANILTLAYSTLEILIGASLGKLILGIQIAGADRKKASYGKLTYRWFIKGLGSFFSLAWLATGLTFLSTANQLYFFVLIVGFFFTLSQKRLAFHDMLSKTAVFRKNDVLDETYEITTI